VSKHKLEQMWSDTFPVQTRSNRLNWRNCRPWQNGVVCHGPAKRSWIGLCSVLRPHQHRLYGRRFLLL